MTTKKAFGSFEKGKITEPSVAAGANFTGIVSEKEAAARHFNISKRQFNRWLQQGCPRLSGGRYDLLQVQGWLDGRNGVRGSGRPSEAEARQGFLGEAESGKDFWDKEGKKFQAKMRELEYQERRGELVERAAVENFFVGRILAVKQGLLALARSLPPRLAHQKEEREMEVIIRRAVLELLEGFSRPLPENLGRAPQVQPSEISSLAPLTQGGEG